MTKEKTLRGVGLRVPSKRVILLYKRSKYKGAAVAELLGKLVPRFCRNGLAKAVYVSKGRVGSRPLCRATLLSKAIFRGPESRFFGISAADRLTFNLRGENVRRARVLGGMSGAIRRLRLRGLVGQDVFSLSNNRGRGVTYKYMSIYSPGVVVLSRPSTGLSLGSVRRLRIVVRG